MKRIYRAILFQTEIKMLKQENYNKLSFHYIYLRIIIFFTFLVSDVTVWKEIW